MPATPIEPLTTVAIAIQRRNMVRLRVQSPNAATLAGVHSARAGPMMARPASEGARLLPQQFAQWRMHLQGRGSAGPHPYPWLASPANRGARRILPLTGRRQPRERPAAPDQNG